MTAEELKQIFGRAVPDRGKLQEIRLRAGKPVLVFMDGREYMVGREGLLEPGCRSVSGPGRSGADPGDPGDLFQVFPVCL